MNKNAFTLVETLAVLVVLGILLTIAIPSITKFMYIDKQKNFAEDARRFITLVKDEIDSNTEIDYENKKLMFMLKDFQTDDELKTSPFYNEYNENSYVIMEYNGDNTEDITNKKYGTTDLTFYKVYLSDYTYSTKTELTYEDLKDYKNKIVNFTGSNYSCTNTIQVKSATLNKSINYCEVTK